VGPAFPPLVEAFPRHLNGLAWVQFLKVTRQRFPSAPGDPRRARDRRGLGLRNVVEITTDNPVLSACTAALRTPVNLRADVTQLRADASAIAVQETVLVENAAVFAGLTGSASACRQASTLSRRSPR
jgi:hypothetical protein